MRIFCDTNIVLEFLQKRMYADEIEKVLDYAESCNAELYISSGSFYTITYITEVHLKKVANLSANERMDQLRNILLGVLAEFSIVPHTNRTLFNGVIDGAFTDLEDSYQAQAAKNAACDILLTINNKDFVALLQDKNIKVLTPVQFVEQYIHQS